MEVCIDLGSSNTVVLVRGREPRIEASLVAFDEGTRALRAVGSGASPLEGRTPAGVTLVQPIRDGVLVDPLAAATLLRSVLPWTMQRPRVILGVPSSASRIERDSLRVAMRSAGAGEVRLVPLGLAAALGADLPVLEGIGCMIVDVGGGAADIDVVTTGGPCVSRRLPLAGDRLDADIQGWLGRHLGLDVGLATARRLKHAIGSALPLNPPRFEEASGRNRATGLPERVVVSSGEVYDAIHESLMGLADEVRRVLNETPPQLAADIHERGLVLVGGGALLRHLDDFLSERTGLPVHVAEDPLRCPARGLTRFCGGSPGNLLGEDEAPVARRPGHPRLALAVVLLAAVIGVGSPWGLEGPMARLQVLAARRAPVSPERGDDGRRLREALRENERLRDLLGWSREIDWPHVPAPVIARSVSDWLEGFTAGVGRAQGVPMGAVVASHGCLVGTVSQLGDRTCMVRPFTSSAVIPCRLSRSDAAGILYGTEIRYLDPNVAVYAGDEAVTSGLNGTFPPGLLLGRVSAIRASAEVGYRSADIVPALDLGSVESVLVMWPRHSLASPARTDRAKPAEPDEE